MIFPVIVVRRLVLSSGRSNRNSQDVQVVETMVPDSELLVVVGIGAGLAVAAMI
jgi:hypothetical protein